MFDFINKGLGMHVMVFSGAIGVCVTAKSKFPLQRDFPGPAAQGTRLRSARAPIKYLH